MSREMNLAIGLLRATVFHFLEFGVFVGFAAPKKVGNVVR
jgi:hypothetical protein